MYHLCDDFDGGCLPAALKERYRVADGPAIKVALFLLYNGSSDQETVADALSLPIDTVGRALVFWKTAGLITDEIIPDKPAKKTAKSPEIKIEETRAPLTSSQISSITLRNPEVSVLLQETQHLLGRPLDSLESRILLEIFEYDELPVDVILMTVAFCLPRVKNKRTIISKAARTASDWRELGVDNAETAEEHIRTLELREQRERLVAKTLELENADFNKTQRGQIARWFEEYSYDIDFVKEAYLRTGKNAVAYINSVLKSWNQNGYKTIRDTRAAPGNAPAPVPKKKGAGSSLLKKAIKKKNNGSVTTNGV